MGYYTTYHLDIKGQIPFDEDDIFEEIEVISGYELDGGVAYQVKWYGHDEDMTEISKKHPDLLFTLDGEGEESGDIWRKYYKNGKSQYSKPEIKFDDFDPEKLK
jgi:hypothetical protein